jgi:hypothetical protein
VQPSEVGARFIAPDWLPSGKAGWSAESFGGP